MNYSPSYLKWTNQSRKNRRYTFKFFMADTLNQGWRYLLTLWAFEPITRQLNRRCATVTLPTNPPSRGAEVYPWGLKSTALVLLCFALLCFALLCLPPCYIMTENMTTKIWNTSWFDEWEGKATYASMSKSQYNCPQNKLYGIAACP